MEKKSLLKSALLTLVIVIFVIGSWEIYLRNKGIPISYDDGPPLWANNRAMVYEPLDDAVVFIGSSRIKYDLDIPTWQNKTNIHAVQLAVEGSNPRPALEDLANDPNFKGRLIVDVTEGLFFSKSGPLDKTLNENIKYFHDRTPAQKISFFLNKPLESQFVFLNKDYFSLNAKLDELEIPRRAGVFMMPLFPIEFSHNTFERQMFMTPEFVVDTVLQNKVKANWAFFASLGKGAPPMPTAELDAIFKSVKVATDKIKARGGEVLFVRTPSSGVYLQGEKIGFPREKYWDKLLTYTNCPGIHFLDYPAIDHFVCPELSHLSRPDAIEFTKHFIDILEKDKNWKLTNSNKLN
ncbi:hypothetical protein [Flavobacterium luteum]|uniref:Uncharacterized protein n=1 Tax=Flavobacterium luteum TaxID=2026654 RepID=A0A7J5ADD7_9FLAO|nr:hypothetical protein [Flavobacterium luteum]KAB1155584.1 hypothetical protein F6464_10745 [Flavobacterium luteum]